MAIEARPPANARQADPEPTTDLIREALGQAREVVRLEVAVAREDLTSKLVAAKTSAIALAAAAVLALMALTLLLVAIALALSVPWLGAALIGAALLALASGLAAMGWRARPRRLLEKTKGRVETDIAEAKERLT